MAGTSNDRKASIAAAKESSVPGIKRIWSGEEGPRYQWLVVTRTFPGLRMAERSKDQVVRIGPKKRGQRG